MGKLITALWLGIIGAVVAILAVPASREHFVWAHAFFKSFFMTLLFGFPMMVFHRLTDTLIE